MASSSFLLHANSLKNGGQHSSAADQSGSLWRAAQMHTRSAASQARFKARRSRRGLIAALASLCAHRRCSPRGSTRAHLILAPPAGAPDPAPQRRTRSGAPHGGRRRNARRKRRKRPSDHPRLANAQPTWLSQSRSAARTFPLRAYPSESSDTATHMVHNR
eukprot:gene16063-biopygen9764